MAAQIDDLKNVSLLGVSIVPQTIATATTTEGTAVDCQLTDGAVHMVVATGDNGDSTLVLNAKLQESADGSTSWTDVTGGAMAQVSGTSGADNLAVMVSTRYRTKRYVRVAVITAGAGTLSCKISAVIMGRKKITGSGTGYQS